MLTAYADHWALITGASSGIGAEFARQLAARGMHMVLTARRESLLTQLAAELHQAHGTKTEIIAADLSNPQEPARLLDEINKRGITIELLINNAGFGHVAEIEKTDVAQVLAMIRVNVAALTELTYRVLTGLLARGHGGIINVASVAAFQPVGYMGAYAASKAYVLHFSEAMWAEARDRGVTITALCPGTTRTNFFDVSGVPGWAERHSSQEVKPVVRAALKAFEKRRQYVISGWKNYLLSLMVRLATRATVVKESMKFFRLKN
ncbi:MAG TPA: SDR family oxidoreductase [Planctomycetaceae bacterium]|nr:SDR family oxidoreductase [Planctomycetaceae bacterium]